MADHVDETRSAAEPGWWTRLRTAEPALVRAVVFAVVGVLLIWGIDLTEWGEKISASWALLFALIPLVQGWWTRSVVTPTAKISQENAE